MFRCECGKEFWVAFRHFRSSNQRQCQDCGTTIRSNKRKLDFSYIQNFVKENSECKLLSDKYINSNHKLDFECKCGNKFSTYFNLFKRLESSVYSFGETIRRLIERINGYIDAIEKSENDGNEQLSIRLMVLRGNSQYHSIKNHSAKKYNLLAIRNYRLRVP